MRRVEGKGSGKLLNQDTFYWGVLKGVGKAYVQVIVDVFCSLAFAETYTSKQPITSADLQNDRLLPFYEPLDVPARAILSDNGKEFCDRPDSYSHELFLQVLDIEHRISRV